MCFHSCPFGWFVGRITQKPQNRCPWNLDGGRVLALNWCEYLARILMKKKKKEKKKAAKSDWKRNTFLFLWEYNIVCCSHEEQPSSQTTTNCSEVSSAPPKYSTPFAPLFQTGDLFFREKHSQAMASGVDPHNQPSWADCGWGLGPES